MQSIAETIKTDLEDTFEVKARLDDYGVRINLKTLDSRQTRILNRISRNSGATFDIKRSGTGIVIIFTC